MAKKKIDDNYDLLFDFGINEDTRTILIHGDIDDESLFILETGLAHLERKSNDLISIRLTSGGGSIRAGNAMIDRILTSSCEIHIHASGEIFSMAILILAAGDYRTSGILTSFMHHESSYGYNDRHSHNKNLVKAMEAEDIRMCKWLASKTKKDFSFWRRTGVEVDHWFSAEQALEYGLIDEVIE